MTAPSRRAALAVVYAIVFLDLLGFGIILPFLPYYALELGASVAELGLVLTSYSLAQLVGASLLGRVSDRRGRRPILLLSLAGASVGMVLSGLATTLAFLVAARALAGLFGGSIATAQAYVADVTTAEERPRFMGFLGASIGLGFVVGPALGVGIDALGGTFAAAAFTAAGLGVANLVWAVFRLPESRPRGSEGTATRPGLGRLLAAFRRPELWPLLLATFATTYAFVTMETTFAPLGEARFGMDERSFGLVLVVAGVVIIGVQGGAIGPLSRLWGVHRVAVAGSVALGTGLAALSLSESLPQSIAAIALLAAGQGLATPSLSSLVSQSSGRGEQGSVLGLGQSCGALARAVGPIAAGGLYELRAVLPFLVGGAFTVLAGVLVATGKKQDPSRRFVD